jgi:predicted anti-sigma-YlaC factor YlaD
VTPSTSHGRGCTGWEVALSARLDGEDPSVDPAALDAHLADCASCRSFLTGAEMLQRELEFLRDEPMPDLVDAILRLIEAQARVQSLAIRGERR